MILCENPGCDKKKSIKGAVSANMSQVQEVLAGAASLNSASEICGSKMWKEVANESSQNAFVVDEEISVHDSADESRTSLSVAILGGSTGEVATLENGILLDVGIEGEDPLPTSLGGGVSQHSVSGLEKVKAKEINGKASETHDMLQSGNEGLGSGDAEDFVTGKERISASKADGSTDLEGAVPECLAVDQGLQQLVPEIDEADREEKGIEHEEPETKQLSKSALKQLAKQERYKEIKLQRKAVEKEKRHQETARKRREWEEKLSTLTEEEKENARLEKLSLRKERKDEQKSRKEKLRQALETGQNLVIDLEFSELMKPNEITSLIQQVMYSYAANGRAAVPGRISLTGVKGDVRKELEKISGFNNWLVHREQASYLEVFNERLVDLVYLTADSENVLDSLDSTKIYVIGGLVDRNRWKNITLEKATRQKIATAKLPIGDHLKMMASQVLTVNQVVELLLCFLEVGDWKKALTKVVPLRKRAAEESVHRSDEH